MDLLALQLTLRPAGGSPNGRLAPLWWARAAHMLLLEAVRQADPPMAERLHDDNLVRPFSVSSLAGRFDHANPLPGLDYSLRLTAIEPGLANILSTAARSGLLAPGSQIELDYIPFQVQAVNPGEQPPGSPWVGAATYSELSAPYLASKEAPPRSLKLNFASPTTFKSGGMHVPVPLPGLVFGSLLERWNAFAPITFPPEVKQYAEQCLAVSHYKLESRSVPMKSGGVRIGAVGQVSYTTLNYDRYWMSVIATLAAFAVYSGVGAGVAAGLGQCRALLPGKA